MANGKNKPTVHMIGNAHIDPVWLWRLDEGRKEVWDTCRSALDRMNETPEFIFTRSSASSYLWIEEDDPEMFAEIEKRVAEGRWDIVNGWWEQPDCNVPGGESYVRQAMYAKEYFHDKFGVETAVGYNVDTFGHNGNLPQILAKTGFDCYVFFRPEQREFAEYDSNSNDLPQIFWWESPDGSRVLACRPPHYYAFGADSSELVARIEETVDQVADGVSHVMCFYGVGNHGGGPTKENFKGIAEYNEKADAAEAIYSRCSDFFDAVRAEKTDFPVITDDLQHHAVGCYSVVSAVKEFNRRCEQALMSAERFAAVADTLYGCGYPSVELRDAWRDVLFNQFHDVLAGTSIANAYEDVYNMYGKALEVADTAEKIALRTIARNVDTRGENLAAVVFNPSTWQRKDVVTVTAEVAVVPNLVVLTDEEGNELHAQIVGKEEGGDRGRVSIMFVADVPALGYRVYRLKLDHMVDNYDTVIQPSSLICGPASLSNEFLTVEVDPVSGAVSSLRTTGGPELLAGQGSMVAVMKDPSDTWSHHVCSYREEIGRFYANGDVRLVEQGPVRGTIEAKSRYGQSTLVQRISVYPGIDRVDVEADIDFQERHTAVKLTVPTSASDAAATYEIPYSYQERKANGHEDPGQKWIDVTGTLDGKRAGITLVNDGKYGFDTLDGEMRMTVLRTAIYGFHATRQLTPKEKYHYVDLGKSRFGYSLVPHDDDWRKTIAPRKGEEFNTAMVGMVEPYHGGSLPKEGVGLVEIGPENVVGTVVKRSQDGKRLIVRMYEAHGVGCQATVELPRHGMRAEVDIGHHEIKTLAFDLGDPEAPAVEVDLLERPL